MIRTGRWWWCWLADYEGPIPVTDVALWHRVQLVPANPTGSRPTHSNPRLSPVHSTSLALPPWLLLPRAPLAHTATLCSDFLFSLSLSLSLSLYVFLSFASFLSSSSSRWQFLIWRVARLSSSRPFDILLFPIPLLPSNDTLLVQSPSDVLQTRHIR